MSSTTQNSHWAVLPLRAKENGVSPTLLVKHEVGVSNYTTYLTDLTNIWTESLDRRQIVRRALDDDTSIDPSEGPDQLALLLRNVQKALTGEHGTNVTISRAKGEGLVLKLVSTLPPPLNSFTWLIHLSPVSPDIVPAQLLLPCMSNLAQARSEVDSLLTCVKEKDHVISRLVDRLQVAGIDLTSIFPGAVPMKGSPSSRESIQHSVKGLASFDAKQWRQSSSTSRETSLVEICHEITQSDAPTAPPVAWKPLGKWWNDASSFNADLIEEVSDSPQQSMKPNKGGESSGDEFQKQPSPDIPESTEVDDHRMPQPTAKKSLPRDDSPTKLAPEDTSSTTDDDLDSPAPISHVASPSKPISFKLNTKKIGIVGGKRKLQDSSIAPSPPAPLSPKKVPPTADQSPSPPSMPPAPSPANKTRGKSNKIGKIGGSTITTSPTSKPVTAATASTAIASSSSCRKPPPSSSPTRERQSRQPSKKTSSSPPPRETSMERADKRRVELERELAAKAKAPAKKQRRF